MATPSFAAGAYASIQGMGAGNLLRKPQTTAGSASGGPDFASMIGKALEATADAGRRSDAQAASVAAGSAATARAACWCTAHQVRSQPCRRKWGLLSHTHRHTRAHHPPSVGRLRAGTGKSLRLHPRPHRLLPVMLRRGAWMAVTAAGGGRGSVALEAETENWQRRRFST